MNKLPMTWDEMEAIPTWPTELPKETYMYTTDHAVWIKDMEEYNRLYPSSWVFFGPSELLTEHRSFALRPAILIEGKSVVMVTAKYEILADAAAAITDDTVVYSFMGQVSMRTGIVTYYVRSAPYPK